MNKNIALKIRIYPNKKQSHKINKNLGCVRYVYNHLLNIYLETGKVVSYKELYNDDTIWLKESDTSSYSNVQINLKKAIKNHVNNPKKFGKPVFKSKHNKRNSYTTSVTNNNSRVINKNIIKIPKVGYIKAKVHRIFDDNYKLKSITISRDSDGKYYASLLYEYEVLSVENQSDKNFVKMIGIDYSMAHLGVLSNNEFLEYPKYLLKNMEKIKKLNRSFSRCIKDSHNFKKRKRDLANLYIKIRNQRNDWLSKTARNLSLEYDFISIEDLDLQEMSKHNHYGKSIYDNSYGKFTTLLNNYMEKNNKKLIKVDKYFPSSKKCSCCGNIKNNLSLSDRIYKCVCGNTLDRDINAALNIALEGFRMQYNISFEDIEEKYSVVGPTVVTCM